MGVDVPVVKQRHVPWVQKVQKPVAVPVIETVEKVVDVPVIKQVEVPQVQNIEKVVEIPQVQTVEKVVEVPEVQTVAGATRSVNLPSAPTVAAWEARGSLPVWAAALAARSRTWVHQ